MKRYTWILILFLLAGGCSAGPGKETPRKPNILLIMTDQQTADAFTDHIRFMVYAYQIIKEEKYISKAEAFVRTALEKMFDDYSPLPRINTSDTLYAGDGTGYANFYHAPGGSDDLMWALALFAKEAGCEL